MVAVGLVLIGLAVFGDHSDTVVATLLVLGVVLVVVGALLPYIEEVAGGTLRVRTRNSDVGKLGQEVEEIRKTKPDPESVDLAGEDHWDGARYRLGERALEWLLIDLAGHLEGCEARVFLYDADERKLMPAWRPPTATSHSSLGWEVGQGVTGRAYQKRQYISAKWQRTHDDTFGLTAEMKARYAKLTAVAAVPLFDPDGKVIGTLSLSSEATNTKLITDLGYSEHLALAEQVAVVLVDLLRVTA